MVCTFFGHRDAPDCVRALLRETLQAPIEQQNVSHFYVGNQGRFDAMALDVLTEFEHSHAVSFDVVLAYQPNGRKTISLLQHTLLPEGIETVPPRFAIDYRNRWMLARSSLVVTYVCAPVGGAAKYKQLAESQKKTVIELCQKLPAAP